jgi:hypothetical protein
MQNKVIKALRTLADRLEKFEEDASLNLSVHPEDPMRLSALLRINTGSGVDKETQDFYGVME